MKIKITNRIEIKDDEVGFKRDSNSVVFDHAYDGDSSDIQEPEDGYYAVKDFKLTNANKFTYELKPGNNFDLLIQQDVIRTDSIDNIVGIYIYCYESASVNPFRIPIRFDVFLEDTNVSLGKMSELSLGNIKDLNSDIRISGIEVPTDSKATLVIIIAVNDN